jgi:hypothetical protein
MWIRADAPVDLVRFYPLVSASSAVEFVSGAAYDSALTIFTDFANNVNIVQFFFLNHQKRDSHAQLNG